jgi:tRNA(His) guanylyltransferase
MHKKSVEDRHEECTRVLLPRGANTIIKISGQIGYPTSDSDMISVMDQVAVTLCEEIPSANLAYVNSSEILILLIDANEQGPWLDGNLQLVVSTAAAIATAKFNDIILDLFLNHGNKKFFNHELTLFTASAFTISDPSEVTEYFKWKQHELSDSNGQDERGKNGGLILQDTEKAWISGPAPIFKEKSDMFSKNTNTSEGI